MIGQDKNCLWAMIAFEPWRDDQYSIWHHPYLICGWRPIFILSILQRGEKDSLGRLGWFKHWTMVSVRKPMTCPKCYKKISFLSSLIRRSNLSFECPHCKTRVGVSLDKRYWIRQLITVPIYIYAIAVFTNFHNFVSIFSLSNILTVLLIGVIGTYEGWRLFWFLELKDKTHK